MFPSVFRELLQNSDDARSDAVEVHFDTAAYLDRRDRRAEIIDIPTLPDLESISVIGARSLPYPPYFADLILQGYAMDFQKQRESIYRERLDATPDDWCVNYYSLPPLSPISFFTCQLKETLAQTRSVPSVSVSRIYFLGSFCKCYVNAFAGFYSLFSVTERPFVSSGGMILFMLGRLGANTIIGHGMRFYWRNNENQVWRSLFVRSYSHILTLVICPPR